MTKLAADLSAERYRPEYNQGLIGQKEAQSLFETRLNGTNFVTTPLAAFEALKASHRVGVPLILYAGLDSKASAGDVYGRVLKAIIAEQPTFAAQIMKDGQLTDIQQPISSALAFDAGFSGVMTSLKRPAFARMLEEYRALPDTERATMAAALQAQIKKIYTKDGGVSNKDAFEAGKQAAFLQALGMEIKLASAISGPTLAEVLPPPHFGNLPRIPDGVSVSFG